MTGGNKSPSAGYLFVWTNVDPIHEVDFNKWYDREHVEERVGISGFVSGIRYVALEGNRRYLGLYRTESLDVFGSESYRQAFAHQTPWSVTNLGRMQNSMRRVCTVVAETGAGTGAFLAVLRLGRPAGPGDLDMLCHEARDLQTSDGIIATRVLLPDAGLSSPLPAEQTEGRILDPILVVEATSEAAAARAAYRPKFGGVETAEPSVLRMMWQMTDKDLATARTTAPQSGGAR